MNRESKIINSKSELSQPVFPETSLLKFVEKIYSKVPVIEGAPNLKEIYINAIFNKDLDALKDLARALIARLDYDRKYQGCKEDAQSYKQERGYSWEELNSVCQQLQNWIEKSEG